MSISKFIEAFDMGVHGSWEECRCGKIYYGSEMNWDWDEGEFEEISQQENAVPSEYDGVSRVQFEGMEFVSECSCWHERAKKVMGFLDSHRAEIGSYFRLEKARIVEMAESFPVDV